jgi:hypothetical protein
MGVFRDALEIFGEDGKRWTKGSFIEPSVVLYGPDGEEEIVTKGCAMQGIAWAMNGTRMPETVYEEDNDSYCGIEDLLAGEFAYEAGKVKKFQKNALILARVISEVEEEDFDESEELSQDIIVRWNDASFRTFDEVRVVFEKADARQEEGIFEI